MVAICRTHGRRSLPLCCVEKRTLSIRPSKLDCLFSAMESLLLHAGGRVIFIIHCHFLLISYSIFKNLELVCEGFNTHDGPGNDCSYYRNAYKSHVGLQITARRANFAQL